MDSSEPASSGCCLESNVDAAGRKFSIRVMRFENGAFVSVCEGSARIGPTVVSVCATGTPATTTVIPAKTDSLFLKLAAEMISSKTRGISMTSMSVNSAIPPDAARAILSKITDMIQ